MDQMTDTTPIRTYIIKRSTHLGYGFVAGNERPCLVKAVEPNGPSFRKLQPGDVIVGVNGINVENIAREQIITMINKSFDEIEIQVRKDPYGDMIREFNMTNPRFYQLNQQHDQQHNAPFQAKSSPPNTMGSNLKLPHNSCGSSSSMSPFAGPINASHSSINNNNMHNLPQPRHSSSNGDEIQPRTQLRSHSTATSNLSHMDRLVTSISHQQQKQKQNDNHNYLNTNSPALPSKTISQASSMASSMTSSCRSNGFNANTTTEKPQLQKFQIDSPIDCRPVLQQQNGNDNFKNQFLNGNVDSKDVCITTRTLNRNPRQTTSGYGRHSPIMQRCKSSIDGTQTLKAGGKKFGDAENDQPMLKRSNTMRPIRPPPKVMEIFKVVIKIFFEDGTTRVIDYNSNTTVATILDKINSRLIEKSPYSEQISSYFGLVLTFEQESLKGKSKQESKPRLLHVLDENDSIMKIRHLRYSTSLRLLYRMVYPPSDVNELYVQNKVAFEYLYKQSVNDLRLEQFNPKPEQDDAFKLVAFTLIEYVYSNYPKQHGNSKNPKVFMRLIKKSPGIEYFLPKSMVDELVDKKGKKIVTQKNPLKKIRNHLTEQLRKNFEEFDLEPPKAKSLTNLERYSTTSFHELSLPELNSSPVDYIKLVFLNCLSQLPCYGNSKRPVRKSASPVEATSGTGDFSSSLESFPRTSDSSPLIRQDQHHQSSYQQPVNSNRVHHPSEPNNIARIAQMNNMRPITTVQSNQNGHSTDRPDTVTTPSIESLSSIAFNDNLQGSPSPQQTASLISVQPGDSYHTGSLVSEPSPIPRQNQVKQSNMLCDNWALPIIASTKPNIDHQSIEESIRCYSIPPPPPSNLWNPNHILNSQHMNIGIVQNKAFLTKILTDQDLEILKVPPPPRAVYQS